MTFEIRVNNKKFTLWESASLTRSIERNSGAFRFTSTNTRPADFPVKKHDRVEIVLNGQTKLTGFVDNITASGSSRGQDVTVTGRDNTRDLIDSMVPNAAKSITTPTTLIKMCEFIIATLGADIGVINRSGVDLSFAQDVEINADSGKKVIDYLVEFARKKQVYLVADGQGNLAIYRPSSSVGSTQLVQSDDGINNNILSYSFEQNGATEYRTYLVTSQDNFGSDPSADPEGGVDRFGISVDLDVPRSRYFEIQSEESMSADELKSRSVEESNIRKAQGFTYSVDVQGVTQNNGELWDFGLVVPVRDSVVGVNGLYMVKDVTYSVNVGGGTVTSLTLTRPEAYKVRGTTQQDERISPVPEGASESVVFNRNRGTFGLTTAASAQDLIDATTD